MTRFAAVRSVFAKRAVNAYSTATTGDETWKRIVGYSEVLANTEVLEHPAHSPDLAPSDYRLFGPLKDPLQGRQFAMDKEVQAALHKWKTFFSDGISKIVFETQRDFIGK